jgi:uncharacterized membrane protein
MRAWIELSVQGLEGLAVAIILGSITTGTLRWPVHSTDKGSYDTYRITLGKTLLIGLELLVAADIVRTVTLDLTLSNLAVLAGLVIVRTFLGWTLTVEVEGRWPWQKGERAGSAPIGQVSGASPCMPMPAADSEHPAKRDKRYGRYGYARS